MKEIADFKQFLEECGYPESLIGVECAWVAQQPKGTASKIIENTKFVLEFINERRTKQESSVG